MYPVTKTFLLWTVASNTHSPSEIKDALEPLLQTPSIHGVRQAFIGTAETIAKSISNIFESIFSLFYFLYTATVKGTRTTGRALQHETNANPGIIFSRYMCLFSSNLVFENIQGVLREKKLNQA